MTQCNSTRSYYRVGIYLSGYTAARVVLCIANRARVFAQ